MRFVFSITMNRFSFIVSSLCNTISHFDGICVCVLKYIYNIAMDIMKRLELVQAVCPNSSRMFRTDNR